MADSGLTFFVYVLATAYWFGAHDVVNHGILHTYLLIRENVLGIVHTTRAIESLKNVG